MIRVINKFQEAYSPKLSCFWFMKNNIYGDELKLKDATAQGDYLVDDTLHYFLWDSVKLLDNEFANKEYDYYPRGRVRFNIKTQQAEVIADEKIIYNENARNIILNELGLALTTKFITDEHYTSIGSIA